MASTQYVPFATGDGANTLDPVTYAGTPSVQIGVVAGIAKSNLANTVWRQSSVVAAALTQFVANATSTNVVDDGNVTALAGLIAQAIQSYVPSVPSSRVFAGDDSSGNAATITVTTSPTMSAHAADNVIVVGVNNACVGATNIVIDGLASRSVVRNDGSATASGDWPQYARLILVYDGTNYRLVDFTGPQIDARVTNTTNVPPAITNYISTQTTAGANKYRFFTANVVNTDIAVAPAFTTVQSTTNLAGCTYLVITGNCALRNIGNGGTAGGTIRLQLFETSTGTNNLILQGDYEGGGVPTDQAQIGLTTPEITIGGLDKNKHYLALIVAQKGSGGNVTQTYDPSIRIQTDGYTI